MVKAPVICQLEFCEAIVRLRPEGAVYRDGLKMSYDNYHLPDKACNTTTGLLWSAYAGMQSNQVYDKHYIAFLGEEP